MVVGLYHSRISEKKAIGYCWKHHAALTVSHLKCKSCLKKQCNALEKFENHEYWHQRDLIKQKRKENKMKRGF